MTTTLKKIALIALCAVLLVGVFGFTFAFADDLSSYPELGFNLSTYVPSSFFLKITKPELGTSSSSPTWLFNNVYCYLNGTNVYFGYFSDSDNSYHFMTNPQSWSNYDTYMYFFFIAGTGIWSYSFNSVSYPFARSAVGTSYTCYIQNDPLTVNDISPSVSSGSSFITSPVTVYETVSFSLEPGYAYVIEGVCEVSDRTFSLTGTSNLSVLSNKNGSVQWFGSVGNIRDNFSPDLNNASNIFEWTPLNANPSGAASNYSYHATDVINVSSGSAFVVTYPLYYGSKYVPTGSSAVVENAVNMTGSIYIQYSGDRPTMRRVALKSEQTFSDNFVSYYNVFMPSVLNETVSYTVSDGTVVVDPSTAPSGGADAGSPSEDVDNSILGVLQRFINYITGLISSGSNAIQELVTLGSSFMLSISAMYGWLPTGLTTLIITAFTIVLVIGVIKLLWK